MGLAHLFCERSLNREAREELMKRLSIFFTTVTLFTSVSWGAIPMSGSDEDKFKDIMSGRLIDCSSFRQTANPTLYFETIGPKALVNDSSTQLSLQMKVVYYRCQESPNGENTFSVVDPKTPYQYDLEQFDGSISTIKVNKQQYRFSAMLGKTTESNDIKQGVPARVDTDGLLNLVRLDLPLEKLLNAKQKLALQRGDDVDLNVRVVGALSTDYRIGNQSSGETGFVPGTALRWKIKLQGGRKAIKAEFIQLKSDKL